LVRQIGRKRDLSQSASGGGADGGRDLFLTETLVGKVSTQKLKWLVSCKDKAASGEAVSEADLPAKIDKLGQHHADGFLLVTTTIPGTASKELLDKLDKSNGGEIYTGCGTSLSSRRFFLILITKTC
jgi:Restriction endonuclease